jgi:hypothetical protein
MQLSYSLSKASPVHFSLMLRGHALEKFFNLGTKELRAGAAAPEESCYEIVELWMEFNGKHILTLHVDNSVFCILDF